MTLSHTTKNWLRLITLIIASTMIIHGYITSITLLKNGNLLGFMFYLTLSVTATLGLYELGTSYFNNIENREYDFSKM